MQKDTAAIISAAKKRYDRVCSEVGQLTGALHTLKSQLADQGFDTVEDASAHLGNELEAIKGMSEELDRLVEELSEIMNGASSDERI